MSKYGMSMSKSKDILPDSKTWKKNIPLKFKGQSHTEFMNVRDTSYLGHTLTCQYDYVKGQKN